MSITLLPGDNHVCLVGSTLKFCRKKIHTIPQDRRFDGRLHLRPGGGASRWSLKHQKLKTTQDPKARFDHLLQSRGGAFSAPPIAAVVFATWLCGGVAGVVCAPLLARWSFFLTWLAQRRKIGGHDNGEDPLRCHAVVLEFHRSVDR